MDEIDALVNELPDEIVEYIAELQEETTQLRKRLEEVEVNKADEADEEDDRDAIEKAFDALPEELQAIIVEKFDRLAELEAEQAEEAIAKRDAEFVAKARAFDGLGDPDELGPALRRLADESPEDAELIEKALSAAAAQTEETQTIYDEIGHAVNKSADSDTVGKVEAIAKSYQEANPALSDEDAMAQAWEHNPELYDEYVLEQRNNQRL